MHREGASVRGGGGDVRPKNSLDVLEQFFGEEVSVDLAKRIAGMPLYQLRELVLRLIDCYTVWFIHERHRRAKDERENLGPIFQPIIADDGTDSIEAVERSIEKLKPLLLYFPGGITVIDPVTASPAYLHSTDVNSEGMNAFFRGNIDVAGLVDGEFRDYFSRAVAVIAQLRPLIVERKIIPIPLQSVEQRENIARALLERLPPRDRDLWNPSERREYEQLLTQMVDSNDRRHSLDWGMAEYEALGVSESRLTHSYALKLAAERWLWFGSALDYDPVATDRWSKTAIQRGLKSVGSTPGIDTRVATALRRFSIPGLEEVPIADVVRLRNSEEAFAEFRSAFEQVLRLVLPEKPDSAPAFSTELARASNTLLIPRVAEIDRRRRQSPALDHMLSGALSVGAAVAEHAITHTFPVGTTLTTIATHSSWMLSRIRRRFSREGRDEALLREFYGYMIPAGRSS
jgi:hypothetical protein